MSRSNSRLLCLLSLIIVLLSTTGSAVAQTSVFTYQGRLTDGGTLANGNYDLQFALWDSASGGSQIGSTQTLPAVQVSSGIFTVTLDFGANAFPGANRFLEISARLSGANSFTLLSPRQQITSTPYAVRSLGSAAADALSSACAGCVTDANISGLAGSKITGTIPVASVPAGSSNYIQNTTNQQSVANFNISGSGTAGGVLSGNIVNATTQYNIAGSRVLSTPLNNLFVGVNAGTANTTGDFNSFFGRAAGFHNTTGQSNSFFGAGAGDANTTGGFNSFFGESAGEINTTEHDNTFIGTGAGRNNGTNDANSIANFNTFVGSNAGFNNTTGGSNSFAGANAGKANTTGYANAFFGTYAGFSNTTGANNSFFGQFAGLSNSTGNSNSFFGVGAGETNTMGFANSFFGVDAGGTNTTGNGNSFFGFGAGFSNQTGHDNVFSGNNTGLRNTTEVNNTFIGSQAGLSNGMNDTNSTANNNTFVGSLAGNNNTTGGGNTFVGFEAGFDNGTATNNSLFGFRAGELNTGSFNAFFGSNAGVANTTAINNSFFGQAAGFKNTTGHDNTFIGNGAGLNNIGGPNPADGTSNTFVGSLAGSSNTTGGINSFFGFNSGNANTLGNSNSFFGMDAGLANTTGSSNSFFGWQAGISNIGGTSNTFIGENAGVSNTTGNKNTFIGSSADGAAAIINATAVGANASATQSNSLVLGSINGTNGATADTNVGIGTTAPGYRLDVAGIGRFRGIQSSATSGAGVEIQYGSVGGANRGIIFAFDRGTNTAHDLLLNHPGGNVGIGTTAPTALLTVNGTANKPGGGSWDVFSDERLKNVKGSFTTGLKAVILLQPLRYEYKRDNALGIKSDGEHVGFSAQAVQRLIPEAVTKSDKGYLLVNNDPILWTMLNAIKEQQKEIEHLKGQIRQLQGAAHRRRVRR